MRNLILLGLTFGLATVIFFFQEQKAGSELVRAFDFAVWEQNWGRMQGTQTPKAQEFLREFDSIAIKKRLPLDIVRKHLFPSEKLSMNFVFERGKVSVTLGNKLDFAHSFYLQIDTPAGTSVVVADDSASAKGAYLARESHRHDLKYRRIKRLFQRDLSKE